ncbi:MAG: serpin family protein [Clostridia bacterium]|nr:serpin family protein [Clostridia bacterium]
MRKALILFVTVCLLGCNLFGCAVPPSQPDAASDVTFLTAEEFSSDRVAGEVGADFRNAYADFAIRLLKASQDLKGRLVSPLSVMTALQMAANGAKGETLRQFEKLLGGNMDVETLNRELFNYYRSLNDAASKDAKFEAANAVWMTNDENFKVAEEFIRVISNTFDAQLAQASFTDPKTVDAINDWCRKHTDDMIPEILKYNDVGVDTTMVLLNAILFDALWSSPYEEGQCRTEVFYTAENGTVKDVTMMYCEGQRFIKGEHETGFFKYYQGGYAFVALLPESGMSLDSYLATLDGTRFTGLMDGMQRRSVDTGLPKFSFDWSASLVETLKGMGLTDCFDPARSDLSGLGTYDSYASFCISDVIHKTHIEVDQSGTSAAAVTSVIVDRESSTKPEEKPKVILNRPFVYAIVDTANMLPVFIGTVTNP